VSARGEFGARHLEARPRVLLVIKCMGYGGAERLLVDLLAARDRGAFDYEFAYVLASEDALVPAVEASGVRVHCLGARHNGDLRWTIRLRRLLAEGNFDIVHFHLPYAAALGRLVARSLPRGQRPALMYTEHSLWHKTATPVRILNRATIGLDKALVAVSPAAHDALPSSLRAHATVVIHGVDLAQSDALISRDDEIRAEVRSELVVPADEILVLAVANLRTEKGYDVLLETARILADQGLPIRIAAVGRGPLQVELSERHSALGLGDRFTFLGQRDDVLRLMTGADVFVLASHHEGLPVALMEAMSVGLPVVATAVGGVPQFVVDSEEGLLVAQGRPDLLADALIRVCSDSDLRRRLGEGAKRKSIVFDVRSASAKIEDIYRRLVETPG
jgi:glycosyltransferase involved in cell wall biosynthesis